MIICCWTINYCFPFHRRIGMWVIYLAYSIPDVLDSERYWFYNEVSCFFFLVTLITFWSSKNVEIFNFNNMLSSRKMNLVGILWVGYNSKKLTVLFLITLRKKYIMENRQLLIKTCFWQNRFPFFVVILKRIVD